MAAAGGSERAPGQRVVHLQGADPAATHRETSAEAARRGHRPRKLTAPQAAALARTSRPIGPHPGSAAILAIGRTRGLLSKRGDVVAVERLGLSFKKKTLRAAEQDSPDVAPAPHLAGGAAFRRSRQARFIDGTPPPPR